MIMVAGSLSLVSAPSSPPPSARTVPNPSQPGRSLSVVRTNLLLVATLVLALLVSLGTPTPAAAASTAEIATDVLNLRTEPGTWGRIITEMTWGESVEVLDGPTNDGWYYVDYYGNVGWASGDYLSFGGVGGYGGSGERWIDVDRSSHQVTLYVGNEPVASYWAALGYDDSVYGYYATAIGTYYVYNLWQDLSWTEYGQAYITNWVGFDPERVNGFHSWSMDQNGNVIAGGDGATGGCVATDPWASAEIFHFAEIGMRVEVHW